MDELQSKPEPNAEFYEPKLTETSPNIKLSDLCRLSEPFTLSPLPYEEAALEPCIDAETMQVHHDKHHKTYVEKLNAALKEISQKELGEKIHQARRLDKIFENISAFPPAIRNNAGGHFNHSFFWSVLTPEKAKQKIPSRLKNEIEVTFGSIDNFKKEFEKAGVGQFGSGWVWLIRTSSGKLNITSTRNQDNPLMKDVEFEGHPILAVDVWEHAYYLKYHEKRSDYLKEIWSVINWDQVNSYDLEAVGETIMH